MESQNSNTNINKKRTWSEVNKARKEERKKLKENKLHKKTLKNLKKDQDQDAKVVLKDYSTVSIAVPGSILENAQSPELRTYLAGQIARAACIFQIDEIVVFDDYGNEASAKKSTFEDSTGTITARRSSVQFGRILQYLECPQYLRKSFFPIHKDLQYCGILNPLNVPHHLSPKDDFIYREGVVLNTPAKDNSGSLVNVGLLQNVRVDKLLLPGIRCTVKLLPQDPNSKKLKGVVVSPNTPRKDTGIYWGYTVRIANSLSQVFSQCPYKEGYDITIGTSDKGTSVDDFSSPTFKHLLIMFGGVSGLEFALENDHVLAADDPKLLFDYYLNTLPEQGCRTIRTEEAILVTLATLRPKLNHESKAKHFTENSCTNKETTINLNIVNQSNINEKDDLSRFD